MLIDGLVWLSSGGVVGWLASRLLRTPVQEAVWLNLLLGMIGALMTGYWVLPWFAVAPGTSPAFLAGIDAIALTSLGALALLLVVNAIPSLLRRRHWR